MSAKGTPQARATDPMRPARYAFAPLSQRHGAKAWCYLCDDWHPWTEPCAQLLELDWVAAEFPELVEADE